MSEFPDGIGHAFITVALRLVEAASARRFLEMCEEFAWAGVFTLAQVILGQGDPNRQICEYPAGWRKMFVIFDTMSAYSGMPLRRFQSGSAPKFAQFLVRAVKSGNTTM